MSAAPAFGYFRQDLFGGWIDRLKGVARSGVLDLPPISIGSVRSFFPLADFTTEST